MSTIGRFTTKYLFLGIFLACSMLRILCALFHPGTQDLAAWETFAKDFLLFGLGPNYEQAAVCNHPPLGIFAAALSFQITTFLDLPFSSIFRLFMTCVDLASCVLLSVFLRERQQNLEKYFIPLLFWILPCSWYVSSIHGNTDSLCVMFILLSLLLFERKIFFLAGIAIGIACDVKLLALFAGMALFFQNIPMKSRMLFALGGLIGLAPIVALTLQAYPAFINSVLLYKPVLSISWGLQMFPIFFAGDNTRLMQTKLQYLQQYGSFFVFLVLLVFCLSLFRTRQAPAQVLALTYSILLLLAPSFSLQYLIYPLPFLLLSLPKMGVLYGLLAGGFAVMAGAGFPQALLGFLAFACWLLLAYSIFTLSSSRYKHGFPVKYNERKMRKIF